MGSCTFLCPLCEGHDFSDLPQLLEAILLILSKNLQCPSCNTEVSGLSSLVQHISQLHVDTKDNLDQLLEDFNEFVSDSNICNNNHISCFSNIKNDDVKMSKDFNQTTSAVTTEVSKKLAIAPPMITSPTSSPSMMTTPPPTPSTSSPPSSIDISASQASLLLSQAPPLPTIKSALLASRDKNIKNKLKVPRWDGREVECNQCGWMFDNANFLHLHKVLMHSRRRQGKRLHCLEEFTCRNCGPAEKITFKLFDAYVEHLQVVHNDHRHVCSFCAKAFKLKGSLLVHQRVMHQPFPPGGQQQESTKRIKHEMIPEEEQEETITPIQTLGENTQIELHQPSPVGFSTTQESHQQFRGILQSSELFHQPVQMHQPLQAHQTIQPQQPIQAQQMVHRQVQRAHQPVRTKYQPIQKVPQPINPQQMNPQIHKQPEQYIDSNRELEKGEINSQRNKEVTVPVVKQDDNLSCNVCGKTFLVPSHLSVHSRIHEVKQWECTTCGKKFTTKYFLKKHRRLHTGETPYSCTICGRTFTFQQSYHKHMLYHTDEKPYSCNNCGRAFKELSTLQNHERIHSGERPFVCETCGKSFRQRVSYLVHRRIHTGVLPYNCKDCGKKFRYKVTQRTHKCLGRSEASVVQQDYETTPPKPLSEDTALLPQVPSPLSTDQTKFLPQTDLYQYQQPTSPIDQYDYRQPSSPVDQYQYRQPSSPLEQYQYRQPSSPTDQYQYGQATHTTPPHEITEAFPDIPHEVKQNLLKFRRAQGRRQLSQRLHNILEKSRQARQVSQNTIPPNGIAPLSELQHLSLNELSPHIIDSSPQVRHMGAHEGDELEVAQNKNPQISDVNLDDLMNSYIEDVDKPEQDTIGHPQSVHTITTKAWDKASQNNMTKAEDNDPFNRAVIDFDISALSFDHTHKP